MNSKKRRVTSSLKCSQMTLIVKHSLGDSGFSTFFDHLVLYPTRVLKFYRFCLNTFDIMIVIELFMVKPFSCSSMTSASVGINLQVNQMRNLGGITFPE